MRIYEINTRAHCKGFDQISEAELDELAQIGFDTVWLMGAWAISDGAKKISRITSPDFDGSPYAIPDYQLNPELGGPEPYHSLLERAHQAGLKVLLDFVPNHMSLDSPWIDQTPALFIRSNPLVRKQSTADYFLHRSGEVVAFGRDPYFPPWNDTSQLDYTCPQLRSRMRDVLAWISQRADGVRCDMAMLILKDYIRQMWYPGAPQSWFNERMPGEFWDKAISQTKALRPDFIFLAEAYWGKERRLVDLGFDLAYEKELYDALVGRNVSAVKSRLSQPQETLQHSLFFIENHDEPRAAEAFSPDENLAAAALILSLPGSALIHEGQMEGRRLKLPIQQVRIPSEPADAALAQAYRRLIGITSEAVFKAGRFLLFETGEAACVSFVRQDNERTIVYLGQIGGPADRFASTALDVSPLRAATVRAGPLRLTNLLTGQSTRVSADAGRSIFVPASAGAGSGDRFCLLEAAPW